MKNNDPANMPPEQQQGRLQARNFQILNTVCGTIAFVAILAAVLVVFGFDIDQESDCITIRVFNRLSFDTEPSVQPALVEVDIQRSERNEQ